MLVILCFVLLAFSNLAIGGHLEGVPMSVIRTEKGLLKLVERKSHNFGLDEPAWGIYTPSFLKSGWDTLEVHTPAIYDMLSTLLLHILAF